jgi:putative nucleotidyltransferase with HDIG domain
VIIDLPVHHQSLFQEISKIVVEHNFEAYVIGGYVRDIILLRSGKDKDIDIVCVGDGIALARQVAQELGIRPPQVFKRFGTAMLRYQDTEIEFVGARKESYSTNSRKPEVTPGTLVDDQNRRDFTINALAISLNDISTPKIIDPFGGLTDLLEHKLLRTPLDPDQTFSDDPLRMMRAIRFASQLGFKIHPGTFDGIKRNAHRISIVSQERITVELNKIVLSPKPSIGFTLLDECRLIDLIFPAMANLRGVDYIDGRGHKDNYYHTIQVLDNVAVESDSLWLRWAAIMHDIGKPRTKRFNNKAGWTFHGHDAVGANMTPKIFKKLKLPLDHKMKYVQKLVRLHLRPISLTKENITDSAIRRLLFDAGEDIEDLMLLCSADITTKNPKKQERYLANYKIVQAKMVDLEEKDQLRNWQPPISGEDIMETFGIPPCRDVGTIKTAIREAILDGLIPNDVDAARQYMIAQGKDLGYEPKTKVS